MEQAYTDRMWLIQQPQDGDLKIQTSGQARWNVYKRENNAWNEYRSNLDQGQIARLTYSNYLCYQQYGIYDGLYRLREDPKEQS